MYQFFVEPEQIDVAAKSVIIRGTDVNHIKNVLRMRPGEEVAVSNGIDGKEYRCGILALEEDCVRLELRFIKEDGVDLPVPGTAQGGQDGAHHPEGRGTGSLSGDPGVHEALRGQAG